jgi:D-sedoheptulose 7-phosphate isomerase
VSAAHVEAGLDRLAAVAGASKVLAPQVARIAARYVEVLRGGGTLYFCGNGGSAADAQHVAAEYVVRYTGSRRPLAAVALTTDTSLLTAAGNDLGFEQIFARQVEALCRPGDLLVLHSTSGRSPNLVAAARAARTRGTPTVAFLGRDGGALAGEVDEALVVPSDDTGQIQLLHLALEHLVVELVESALLGAG